MTVASFSFSCVYLIFISYLIIDINNKGSKDINEYLSRLASLGDRAFRSSDDRMALARSEHGLNNLMLIDITMSE